MKHPDSEDLKVNWHEMVYNRNVSIQSYERLPFCNRIPLWRHSLSTIFVEQMKTVDINSKTTSKHVCLICRHQVSPRTFITLLLQQPKFLLLQHEGLLLRLWLHKRIVWALFRYKWQQCFSRESRKTSCNYFCVCVLYKYEEKNNIEIFLFKNPFKHNIRF